MLIFLPQNLRMLSALISIVVGQKIEKVNSAGGPRAARRDDVGGCRDALWIDPGIRQAPWSCRVAQHELGLHDGSEEMVMSMCLPILMEAVCVLNMILLMMANQLWIKIYSQIEIHLF